MSSTKIYVASHIIFILLSFGKSILSHLTFINISESWLNLGRVMCTIDHTYVGTYIVYVCTATIVAKGIMERCTSLLLYLCDQYFLYPH